jgi:hypothetical protein
MLAQQVMQYWSAGSRIEGATPHPAFYPELLVKGVLPMR